MLGKRLSTSISKINGTTRFFRLEHDCDIIFYEFSSFTSPPKIYCYEPKTGTDWVWASRQLPLNASSMKVRRLDYPSKDGTNVPIRLLSQDEPTPGRLQPTILTAYGGFGSSVTPKYTGFGSYLVERGCLFAIANIRGGSEFGEAWHEAGKLHNKQNAIDDFIAAAQWLVRQGYTTSDRLAIAGGSNAGLIVAAAMIQRPDLFRAVLCIGPLLDMLRYHLFDSAHRWVPEYGSAGNASDFASLMHYSPYHNVEDSVPYPAVMLVSGDSDSRCNPMHARKMTARLQAATSSGQPVLLDYRSRWGHMPVLSVNSRIDALTDRLSFLCAELGVHF